MFKRSLRRTVLLLSLLLVAVVAFAEEVAPSMPIGEDEVQALVIGLFAVVLPFITNLIRKAIPTMPRMLVWSIPPVIGALSGWIANYLAATGPLTGWRGLAGGLIAISLWELRTTFRDHGING